MIKNIVFDMGGVIVDYDTERFLRTHFAPEHRALVNENVFLSNEWREADRGTYSAEEALEIMCSRLPENLRDETRKMVLEREKEMPPIEKMYPVVRELKESGYKIYLLSNCPSWFNDFKKSVPAFEFFDGFLISAYCHAIKPDEKIYRIFFDTFSLTPQECFFIDDSAANIEAAEKLGMSGHCFFDKDIEKLKENMRKHEINI